MSIFSSLFGGDSPNPADTARPYFEQVSKTIKPYFDPYVESGKTSLSTIQDQYKKLLNDPSAIMNLAADNFEESPGYQYQYDKGINAIDASAAAGGRLGTPSHQQMAGEFASGAAGQDFWNYINTILGLYGKGLSGEEGLNNQGFQAATGLAENLGSNLMTQGKLAYKGQQYQNEDKSAAYNNMWKGIGALAAI